MTSASTWRGGMFAALALLAGCAEQPPMREGRREILTCSSEAYGMRRCAVDGRVVRVRLWQRLSEADCDYRESWGWNRDGVWVDRGCRAEFEVTTR